MSKEVIFHAETIEEAIEAGLKQLGVERSQVEIEIISEPKEHFWFAYQISNRKTDSN